MKNISAKSIDYVLDSLQILSDNPYALLWDITEDFMCNGHKISIKDSTRYRQAVIDGSYCHIGGDVSITANNKTFKKPIDYVRALLLDQIWDKKETESKLDFGSGTKKEIREAIASKALLKEDRVIKIFNPGSVEYERLEAAAKLLTVYSNKKYFVDETYFDYGQGWKWTTILYGSSDFGAVQALTPKDQEDIISASTPVALGKAAEAVLKS